MPLCTCAYKQEGGQNTISLSLQPSHAMSHPPCYEPPPMLKTTATMICTTHIKSADGLECLPCPRLSLKLVHAPMNTLGLNGMSDAQLAHSKSAPPQGPSLETYNILHVTITLSCCAACPLTPPLIITQSSLFTPLDPLN